MSIDSNRATQAFDPLGVSNSSAVAPSGSSSAATALNLPGSRPDGTKGPVCGQFLVLNSAAVPIFIAFGGSGVVAATTSLPVGAGQCRAFSIDGGPTFFAVFGLGGTGTVYVQPGDGV